MKKLLLLSLFCASAQLQGMDNFKERFAIMRKQIVSKLYSTFYNTRDLWNKAEIRAKFIDHKLKGECCDCPLTDRGYYSYYEEFYDSTDKLEKIYGKRFYSKYCHHVPNGSCFDDFKKFREELEKSRQ